MPLIGEALGREGSRSDDQRVAAVLAGSASAAASIPAPSHVSLIARLDRLGTLPKEVGQVAAVIGRGFDYELIEEVAQRPAAELDTSKNVPRGRFDLSKVKGLPPAGSHAGGVFRDAVIGRLPGPECWPAA